MKKVKIWAVLLILSLWAITHAEGLVDVFSSVARVRVETNQAVLGAMTAWLYEIDGANSYWVSCGHGMDDDIVKGYPILWHEGAPRLADILFKKIPNTLAGDPLPSNPLYTGLTHDFSLLKTLKKPGDTPIPLSKEAAKMGDLLIITCFERDYPVRLFKVKVLKNEGGVISVEPGFAPGMSGSPLVNTRGEVVGVALWAMMFDQHQVLGKAVCIQTLAPMLVQARNNP